MTHKRNTDGMVQAAKQRRLDTIRRVEKAIESLLRDNKAINFNVVAKLANVGKPWLYKEEKVRQRIENLRSQTQLCKNNSPNDSQNISNKSKGNIIAMLKDRIRTLEDENKQLKEQREVLYGKLCMSEDMGCEIHTLDVR
ncbi:MAG: DUF6262 family protein [Gammaproteobacteria bacterium]|jgi:hypothetical protein